MGSTTSRVATFVLLFGCSGPAAEATRVVRPASTSPSATPVPTATPVVATKTPATIRPGDTPRIEARDESPVVAELDGKPVKIPPLSLTEDFRGHWRLVGEADDVEVDVPIVHAPVAGKCIVRDFAASMGGAFVRVGEIGYNKNVGYALQIERVTPTPPPVPPEPGWKDREVGKATLRVHLALGPKPEDAGRPGVAGGFVRGRLVDVPMIARDGVPKRTTCKPATLTDGKPAQGTVAKKPFVVAAAVLEEYPPSDQGAAGWALRLFDQPIRDDHPISRFVMELASPGVREVRFDFSTAPTEGACIAVDRDWMVFSPYDAPRARVHLVKLTPGSGGTPGTATARVDYDWGSRSRVTGKVDGIVVRPLAGRTEPLPIAPRVVDRCD